MKRFLNFKKKSLADYSYNTGAADLREPERTRIRFWQQKQLEKLENKANSALQEAMEKEKNYNRSLSVQLEQLDKQREIELVERHLWAVIEENRNLLQEREYLRKRIDKETKAAKAYLAEVTKYRKQATGEEEEKQRKDEGIGGDENLEEEEGAESSHLKNQDSHAHNRLLDEFFGSEEEATDNLKTHEKDILDKINMATDDKDLKRVKTSIVSKQAILLYAFSLVEIMRFTKNYRGLYQIEEEESFGDADTWQSDEEADTDMRQGKCSSPLVTRLPVPQQTIAEHAKQAVNKPDPIWRWNTQTLPRRLDEETGIKLFRPQSEDILETDV